MKVAINVKILKDISEFILTSIKTKYGIQLDEEFLRKNMAAVKALYVEDLPNSKLQSRPTEIAISREFIKIDNLGKIKGIKKSYEKIVEMGLVHELLHNASRSMGNNGINNSTDNYRGLNEGITQMMTEDFCGNVVSPFFDAYRDFKKVAKIIKYSVGEKDILVSYFYHKDNLKKSCDKLAYDGFYEKLNTSLTELYYLHYVFRKNPLIREIYMQRVRNTYKDLLINIVIPTLKRMINQESRKSYIKSILNSVYDDAEIYRFFKETLSKYLSLDITNLEKEKIEKEKEVLDNKALFVNILGSKTEELEKNIVIKRSGDVRIYYEEKLLDFDEIEIYEKIYSELFRMRSSNYAKKDLRRIIEKIGLDRKITLYESDILERRKQFSAIKTILKEEYGVYLLNNFNDIDNKTIKIDYIKKEKGKPFRYDELERILNRLDVVYNEKTNTEEIIDKKSKMKVTEREIVRAAKFAKVFQDSAKQVYSTKRFSMSEIVKIYNKLMDTMQDEIKQTGNIGLDKLKKYTFNHEPSLMLIDELFKTERNYEIIYSYVYGTCNETIEQTIKETESQNTKYMNIEKDTTELSKQARRL